MEVKTKRTADSEPERRPEIFGAADPTPPLLQEKKNATGAEQQHVHETKPKVDHIEGDEIVLQQKTSRDDGSRHLVDVEAELAKNVLRNKVKNTKDAVVKGLLDALTRPMSERARELGEESQKKVVGLVSAKLKEKAGEWVKKGAKSAAVKGGGAAGRALKNNLGNEATHLVAKGAGAVAVVGDLKEASDAYHEAKVADFRATTVIGLKDEAVERMNALFADYEARVDGMDGQKAVDVVQSGETEQSWVRSEVVAMEFDLLVGAAMIQAGIKTGVLSGGEMFDAVQAQIHPGSGDKK